MKTCITCRLEKPLTEFNRNKKYADGLHRYCRPCHRETQRRLYAKNPFLKKKALARKRAHIAATRERVIAFLAGRLCAGCGEVERALLDLVHVDAATKLRTIAKMVQSNASWSRVEAEIEKCVILCANCRESRRGGHVKWA